MKSKVRIDIYIYIILLFMILFSFLLFNFDNVSSNKDTNKYAVIKVDGKVYDRINLDEVIEPYEIIIDNNLKNVILVEKGRIRFLESECPDHTCVNSGFIENIGSFAACVPNETIIIIEGYTKKDVDGVSY